MRVSIYRDICLGDMLARYYLDEETENVELQLKPLFVLRYKKAQTEE